MVKVKLFGVLRLDCGVKELELEAGSVKELLDKTAQELAARGAVGVDRNTLKGCVTAVNGRQVKPSCKLNDGDQVWLVPAVAGG